MAKRLRYEMVMNIPSPYRLHLLKEVYEQLKAKGVDFHCHFMNRGHKDRPKSWLNPKMEFPHTYWRNIGPDQHEFNPALILKLWLNPPQWLDMRSPYDTFTCILLALLCRAKCKIIGMEGNCKTPGKMTGFIGAFKRAIISRSDYASMAGSDSAKWLDLHRKAHGVGRHFPKTTYLPNVIEESRFHVRAEYPSAEMKELRVSAFGADESTRVCLIPARFDPVKGLKEFFKVVEPSMLKGWKLVIMGHGPEEEATMKIVGERGLSEFVKVIHSVPYEEMPRHYAAADLMLLPSLQDMNPLSVIEALHSGLPLALSCMAGNVEEAVCEGKNGWVLPVLEEEPYRRTLAEVFATPIERLREMGAVSKLENAQYWDTKKSVTSFVDSIGI